MVCFLFICVSYQAPSNLLQSPTFAPQLDRAAAVGLIPLAVLLVTMGVDAALADFPALRSGELPLVRVSWDMAEATALLGYAFYMQPMLMPLLHDLPHRHGLGARVLERAVNIRYGGCITLV